MIPYVGPAVFLVIVSMVAYVQFPTFGPVIALVASILLSTGIIGMLLVPWLTQKASRLNAITVFISLLFWSWLWGTWGLLLGIPVMMALNVVFERIEGLQIISHFLSGGPIDPPRAINGQPGALSEGGQRVSDSMRGRGLRFSAAVAAFRRCSPKNDLNVPSELSYDLYGKPCISSGAGVADTCFQCFENR